MPEFPGGKPGSRNPESHLDCEQFSGRIGVGACDVVLQALCRARRDERTVTVWDLPRSTGLPLHEVFAAVRALEFGKFVELEHNPADPFGAKVRMADSAIERLARLDAA